MLLEDYPEFELSLFSDIRYEKLTVDIKYKNDPVAQINQDKGLDKLELEIFATLENATLKVPLDAFLSALSVGKKLICNQ